jgi:hypothetical protein
MAFWGIQNNPDDLAKFKTKDCHRNGRKAEVTSLKYNQKDATFSRSVYFYKLLYTFQAVPQPIIRSTKLYIQCQVLSNCNDRVK